MYLCMCKGIPVSEVVETARKNTMPLEALVESLGLGEDDSCGRCAIYKQEITKIIAIELKKPQANHSSNGHHRTTAASSAKAPVTGETNRWTWFGRRNHAA